MISNFPLVFIVILNMDGKDVLKDCLDSINKMAYPNYKIVVVDNGSRDGSKNMVTDCFPSVHLIENGRNMGVAEGQNIGIRYAIKRKANYILITNNDVTFDEMCLGELVRIAENDNEIGIVGPKIYYSETPNKIWQAGRFVDWKKGSCKIEGYEIDSGQFDELKEVDYLGVILIKESVFKNIGLYNSSYFAYWEDTDFCVRAHKAGYKVIYVPNAKIWHKVSYTTKKIKGFYEYYSTRNRFWFMKRHATRKQYYSFILYFFGFNIWLICCSFVFRRDTKAFSAFVSGIISGLKNSLESYENLPQMNNG